MAYKYSKASELTDIKKFVELYNDPSKTNKDVMDGLNAEWNAIKVKVASNGTLKAQLTLERTGGEKGKVLRDGKEIDPSKETAPAKASKKKAEKATTKATTETVTTEAAGEVAADTTTATAATGEFVTEEAKEFTINYRVNKYNSGSAANNPLQSVKGRTQIEAEDNLYKALADQRVPKFNLYLNGAITDSSSIPNGATIEVRVVQKAGEGDEEEIFIA